MNLYFRTQLNFIVAIDYTGSNGDPRDPKSLHYFDPGLDSKSYPLNRGNFGLFLWQYFETKKCIRIINIPMLFEQLVTLFKNMIPINNFRLMALEPNCPMVKSTFASM